MPLSADFVAESRPDQRAADFRDQLAKEQTLFLDAMRRACARIPRDEGRMASLATRHGRMTQQFFAAQRSLILRGAELDDEVDRDMRAAELEARTMVLGGVVRASVISGLVSGAAAIDAPTQISAGEAVRCGTRTADAERQLAALLDSWWEAEHDDGREVLDEATAVSAGPVDPVVADVVVPFLTPSEVLDVLDRADLSNLDTVLAALCDPSVGDLPAQILDTAPSVPPEEMPVVVPAFREAAAAPRELLALGEEFIVPTELPVLASAKPVLSTEDDHRTVGSVLLHTVWPMAVIVVTMGVIFLWMG
ncbi:MAG: hypothetical protein RLZZ362_2549 [Actinomycetota bacterium]